MPPPQQQQQPQWQKLQTLPISIVVRNLFPPLAVTTAAATSRTITTNSSASVSVNDSIVHGTAAAAAVGSECHDRNHEVEECDDVDDHNRNHLMMATTPFTSIEGRCAWASRKILHRLRLDIILKNQPSNGDSSDATPTVVYSMEQSHGTSHPRWDHVNERLFSTTLSSTESITDYCARFVILDDANEANNQSGQEKGVVLVEITLDPSKLRCLPPVSQNGTNNNDNIDSISNSNYYNINNNNMTSGMQMIIPHTLPPNTVLLHYDDGYTRVLPSVYSLLLQRKIISEDDNDRDGAVVLGWGKDKLQERAVPLFDEKAFDLLSNKKSSSSGSDLVMSIDTASTSAPGVAELVSSKNNNAVSSSSSLIFDDCIFDLMGSIDGGSSSSSSSSDKSATQKTAADDAASAEATAAAAANRNDAGLQSNVKRRQDDDDDDDDDDDNDNNNEEKEENGKGLTEELILPVVAQETTLPSEDELPPLPLPTSKHENESIISFVDEEEEIKELRQLVQLERQLLEVDWHRITEESNQIKSIMQQVQLLEQETVDVMRTVNTERASLHQHELNLEANRIHLLQQLRLLFPIKLVPITTAVHPPNHPQHQYTISNIPLPEDIHTPTVSDDQVSFALGLVCHLVSLTSKYLAVPLRYTLICKFSRSAVLFDWSYPQGNNNGGVGGNDYTATNTANDTGSSSNANNGSNNNTPTAMMTRAVYPLFRERNIIDREQLDYGRLLLDRNVNCLLKVRNVPHRREWNILAKMEKLLLHVVEGGE